MEWIDDRKSFRVPIKSWCDRVEEGALLQAHNLANHPSVVSHVALMPDCHVGYGMPIGGVIACRDAVIPNAVGVDIGCGMVAVKTDYPAENLDREIIRKILNSVKKQIPVGEGNSYKNKLDWEGFNKYYNSVKSYLPGWMTDRVWDLAERSLGTLGGGNHFIELQKSSEGDLWLMVHSGSRNLGYKIASYYHNKAKILCQGYKDLPSVDLSFLQAGSKQGKDYIRDMTLALDFAYENRRRMVETVKSIIKSQLKSVKFVQEINIHHNYAALEEFNGQRFWIHRKGATSAKEGEFGIIPGSMGTASYIVVGLGNKESFMSCSHGAGRRMGRNQACRTLSKDECDKAMKGIVFDSWKSFRQKKEHLPDLAEAPPAYKNIDDVIKMQLDLIKPIVKLMPLGVVKG